MPNYDTIIRDLRQSIRDEHGAAAAYRHRALSADPVTAKLYKHIAKEEDVHTREFAARLLAVARMARRVNE